MTRQQVIDKHLDRLAGMLLDAALEQRKGAEMTVWLRSAYSKLRAMIGEVHDDSLRPEEVNGHANGTLTKRST